MVTHLLIITAHFGKDVNVNMAQKIPVKKPPTNGTPLQLKKVAGPKVAVHVMIGTTTPRNIITVTTLMIVRDAQNLAQIPVPNLVPSLVILVPSLVPSLVVILATAVRAIHVESVINAGRKNATNR
jgi:hypothetical protein